MKDILNIIKGILWVIFILVITPFWIFYTLLTILLALLMSIGSGEDDNWAWRKFIRLIGG